MALNDLFALLLLIFIVLIFLVWYFIHKAKTKERLLMIEKGIEPYKRKTFNFPWLKIGVILLCGSLGTFLGGIIEYFDFFKPELTGEETFVKSRFLYSGGTISLLFMYIFGAIGMILAHYLDKKKDDK
ncbi:hypothetical protein [Thalassobellus citreus]|uniref:hypothetical protein n=1 Tax=Thalassobellus citreus TaxID=3367752 RepID=UPI0037A4E437